MTSARQPGRPGDTAAGRVVGVGVGPGDPGLLTLRAAEILRAAGLVVAPHGARDSGSLALAVVRDLLAPGCEIAQVEFPMAEESGTRHAAWADAAARLAMAARSGRLAAFVTLGDASLYSTWGYVAGELRRAHPGTPIETVPGVTAASACAAAAGVPLAEAREPLTLWPAEPPELLGELLDVTPNVAFMKAGRHLERLAAAVRQAGAQAVAIRRCGMEGQAVGPPEELADLEPDYFTTVLVRRKEVAR